MERDWNSTLPANMCMNYFYNIEKKMQGGRDLNCNAVSSFQIDSKFSKDTHNPLT